MNEIPEILRRALGETITVTLADPDEARRWKYRVFNHIKRHAPEMKVLMISLHGNQVRIRRPRLEVSSG